MSPDTKESERESLERRVEALAGEIAELINRSSQGEERNDLKDLALSVVREEVRSGEQAKRGEAEGRSGAPFNPIAMGIPLFLIGAMMIVLFPPVGLALFGLAALMVAWGLTASLFSRRGGYKGRS